MYGLLQKGEKMDFSTMNDDTLLDIVLSTEEQIKELKADNMKARNELAARAKAVDVGTHQVDYGSITVSANIKVDEDQLGVVANGLGKEKFEEVFSYKWSTSMAKINKCSDVEKELISKAVTIKAGSPSIKVHSE